MQKPQPETLRLFFARSLYALFYKGNIVSVLFAYLTVVLLWGTTPLAVQWSTEGVDLVFALGARTLIGLLLSYFWMRWSGVDISYEPKALKLYAVSLLGTVGAMYAIYWSSQYIASGLISVLFGLAPIVGGIFASVWLTERFFSPTKLIGVLVSFLGLFIVFYQELSLGDESWKGVLGTFLGVALYSISSVWIKRLGGNYSSLSVNTGSLLASFIVLLLIWCIDGYDLPTEASTRSLAAIIYLGIFGSFVGFVSYYYVLRNMQTSSALLITLISPVIAMYLGAVLNEEKLHSGVFVGSILVLAGLMLYLASAIKRLIIALIEKINFRIARV